KKVYKATDKTGQIVALKAGRYRSPKQLERLQREVDFLAAANLDHFPKHKLFSYDVGNREFLIVEEYIIGKRLSECNLLFKTSEEILKLLYDCCVALSPIWEKRVVHRDLKPDNIMIKESCHSPVIIDLGIARFLDHSSLTDSHALQGPCTPLYAAREQLTNRKVSIDQRTDFFALGVIAAELSYGNHPFSPDVVKSNNDILENIVEGNFFLPDISGKTDTSLRDLISSLIDKEPFRRPRSSDAILKIISNILANQ
ncbi:MAG: hypothetical protein EOP09_00390, partial [Proteobacteria bacterium]